MLLVQRFAKQIKGMLSCFDRLVLTATLTDAGHARSATSSAKCHNVVGPEIAVTLQPSKSV